MLQAKDIMTKDVVTVGPDTPVEEALELMLTHRISGIPVVRKDMMLMGIITEKDLLNQFFGQQEVEGRSTEEFMTQPAIHFDENESLENICKCLAKVTFRRVPVTKDEKIVGIISRPDVLKCVMNTRIPTGRLW